MLMRIASYFVWRAIRPFAMVGGVGLAIGGGLSAQNPSAKMPVFVGGEAQFDACASYGEVAGLKPTPGNFLALRNRPSTDGKRIAKLASEQKFWICSQNGDWFGVVIAQNGKDCGVSTPRVARQPYTGPCRVGWVFGKYVGVIAG